MLKQNISILEANNKTDSAKSNSSINSARKFSANNWWDSPLHFVKNRQDHIKSWSFARILIHANSNQLGKMWWDTRGNGYSQTFQGNLWKIKSLYVHCFNTYRNNNQKGKSKHLKIYIFPHKLWLGSTKGPIQLQLTFCEFQTKWLLQPPSDHPLNSLNIWVSLLLEYDAAELDNQFQTHRDNTVVSNYQELITQWCSAISQKNRNLWYTTVKTFKIHSTHSNLSYTPLPQTCLTFTK